MTVVLDSIFGPAGLHSDLCNAYHILHIHATKLAHFALKLRLRLYLSKIHAMKAPK